MIGTMRLFSVLFCSFSRNIDVVAICRSASIPSIILLLECGLLNLLGSCGYFGCVHARVCVCVWQESQSHLIQRSHQKDAWESLTCAPRAIDTRLLSLRSREVVWSASTLAFFFFSFFRLDDMQFDGQTQKNIRSMQQTKPMTTKSTWKFSEIISEDKIRIFHLLISDGPMRRNSTVLNPFSPVPTNDITKPIATVPNPTYKKAFANELGPRKTPRKSSSSDEPPSDESWIWKWTTYT